MEFAIIKYTSRVRMKFNWKAHRCQSTHRTFSSYIEEHLVALILRFIVKAISGGTRYYWLLGGDLSVKWINILAKNNDRTRLSKVRHFGKSHDWLVDHNYRLRADDMSILSREIDNSQGSPTDDSLLAKPIPNKTMSSTDQGAASARPTTIRKRRLKTSLACVTCRKRKVRCDGTPGSGMHRASLTKG